MQVNVRQDQEVQEEPQSESEELSHSEMLRLKEEEELKHLHIFVKEMREIGLANAPDVAQLLNWKSKFSNIYMNNVTSPEEVFIWRPLSRLEWKEILGKVDMNNSFLREDAILEKCILYPSLQSIKYELGAGYAKSIYSAIMYQSGFVDESQVISSIRIIE